MADAQTTERLAVIEKALERTRAAGQARSMIFGVVSLDIPPLAFRPCCSTDTASGRFSSTSSATP